MPVLDFFHKKKKIKKEDKKEKQEVKKAKEVKKVKEVKPSKVEVPKLKKRKEVPQIYRILKSPHISEKSTDLIEKSQYVFKVFPNTNKTEIKKAIESHYGVDVLSVNLIKIPAKRRRLGRITGFRKGYKKAIIKIKKGQKIEIL